MIIFLWSTCAVINLVLCIKHAWEDHYGLLLINALAFGACMYNLFK